MKTLSDNAAGGINLGPCQICDKLKEKFYLCLQNHSTCEGCKINQKEETIPPRPGKKQVHFSILESPPRNTRGPSESSSANALSPSSPPSVRSPPRNQQSIFSSRSAVPHDGPETLIAGSREFNKKETHFLNDSLQSARRRSPPPPTLTAEDGCSDGLRIFCAGCGDFVEVTLMTLPMNALKSLVPQCLDLIDTGGDSGDVDEDYDDTASVVPSTSVELYDDEGLRKDVDNLRIGLATAYSELLTTRGDLDEVMYLTEKLEMDVDMLRGGVNYVYFNFDTVLKRGEVRIEERICGIPFVLMVRMRNVAQVPHLGFFIGLEPYEGRAHSPLKKTIVFRAHNAYGKVIEKLALATFENGECAHPCFDVTQRQDGGLFGYANFLKRDRILKPDMLKDGRLCLSLQIKPLS